MPEFSSAFSAAFEAGPTPVPGPVDSAALEPRLPLLRGRLTLALLFVRDEKLERIDPWRPARKVGTYIRGSRNPDTQTG